MNTQAELYSLSIGNKLKEVPQEEQQVQEALAYEEKRLHEQWLNHPTTEKMIEDVNKILDDSLSKAMLSACAGNTEVAMRNLIKAQAFKEVINYARRKSESGTE